MTPKLSRRDVIERVAASLQHARWAYDEDADELEVVLPGGDARPGRTILLDSDVYLRLDADTNEPLTIIVPAFSSWMSRRAPRRPAPPPTDDLHAWTARFYYDTAAHRLRRTVRDSNALAAAVP
jgi:hypothetical protein